MAMYVVQATVTDVRPRRVGASRRPTNPATMTASPDHPVADSLTPAVVTIDFGDPADDRLARWRRLWAQTTFYLFDPEGWR